VERTITQKNAIGAFNKHFILAVARLSGIWERKWWNGWHESPFLQVQSKISSTTEKAPTLDQLEALLLDARHCKTCTKRVKGLCLHHEKAYLDALHDLNAD
jgi:hypothetical protein